jgi:hypothetical protein
MSRRTLMCVATLVLAAGFGCGSDDTGNPESDASGTAKPSPGHHHQGGAATSGRPVTGQKRFAADLKPVSDSSVRGTVELSQRSEGVKFTLKAEGLPDPDATYFARVHEGSCAEASRTEDDLQRGGAGGPVVAVVRADRLLAETLAFLHPGHEHTEDGVSGTIDVTMPLTTSDEGRGAATTLLQDLTVERLISGSPTSVDLTLSSDSGSPVLLACASLSGER